MLTEDGKGAKYSGVMYRSATFEIIVLRYWFLPAATAATEAATPEVVTTSEALGDPELATTLAAVAAEAVKVLLEWLAAKRLPGVLDGLC